MHRPIPGEGNWPKQVVNGFFVYYAVPTNFCVLLEFRARINGLWLRTLRRRSQKDQTNWERITMLADDFLPQPRILHPWPNHRFGVTHPRWAPNGESRTYGVVRGASSNGRPSRNQFRTMRVSESHESLNRWQVAESQHDRLPEVYALCCCAVLRSALDAITGRL